MLDEASIRKALTVGACLLLCLVILAVVGCVSLVMAAI